MWIQYWISWYSVSLDSSWAEYWVSSAAAVVSFHVVFFSNFWNSLSHWYSLDSHTELLIVFVHVVCVCQIRTFYKNQTQCLTALCFRNWWFREMRNWTTRISMLSSLSDCVWISYNFEWVFFSIQETVLTFSF